MCANFLGKPEVFIKHDLDLRVVGNRKAEYPFRGSLIFVGELLFSSILVEFDTLLVTFNDRCSWIRVVIDAPVTHDMG